MHRFLSLTALATAALFVSSPCAGAAETEELAGDPYPLATCPVSDQKLGSMGEPIVKVYDGREVRFCCQGCVEPFEQAQQKYIEKINERLVRQQQAWYPLDTCVVSGQELGSMGDPVEYVYKNRLVRLCCEGCVTAVEADPAKYMKRLNAAVIEAQGEDYPRDTCVVSGQELGSMGEPARLVIANKLVRLCCEGCAGEVMDQPAKYLAMADATESGEESE